MITKLEVYGIAIVLVLVLTIGAFFLGDYRGKEAQLVSQAKADEATYMNGITTYEKTLATRSTADDLATQKSQALIAAYDQGLINVQNKLKSAAPLVVKGTDGCPILSDSARILWNASEQLLSTGSTDNPATGEATGPVRPAAGAPAR